ncbi:sulfotransferase [Aquibium carbonis]|nr:sulfotransferase [Aquibium carbonis]
MPEICVVLGMHKSGTTLVSEILHHSGIRMVEDDSAETYDLGNHFEREDTNRLNKRLLDCGEAPSIRVVDRLDLAGVTPDLRVAAQALVEAAGARDPAWGFKDPRTCLTYDFWKAVLPEHRLVCVFRDVREVHAHYLKRRRYAPLRGLHVLRAWEAYNRCMLDAYTAAPSHRRILVDYARLMRDDVELARLGAFVGRNLVDRRIAGLRRNAPVETARLRCEAWLHKRSTGRDAMALDREIRTLAEIEAAGFVRG